MAEWEFALNNQPMSKIKGRGISEGCITLERASDFAILRRLILQGGGTAIRGSTLKAYGVVSVRCGG